MIFLMFFVLVQKVYAFDFFYNFWDTLWYDPIGYGYWDVSFGYFLIVASLLYAVFYPLSQKIKVFEENKGASTIFSIVLASSSLFE